ncbi:MAG TPA: hypothetical protein VFW04_00630 [Gemmatimonadaceae bacterium]|nr:hypothetical protein [Gemmatimonadaceae bacterium]
MNVDAIEATLASFVARHRTTFARIGTRQSQILELAAIIGVSQHYVATGFGVQVVNPKGSSSFIVKSATRGHPADYSRIACSKGGDAIELHTNLMVQGAHDDGIYCVDVGIAAPGRVPDRKGKEKWVSLANSDLRSFAEVKKLVVFPMLLAQFVGIVHEIRPEFLVPPTPANFGAGKHLPPTLISLGHFSGNSRHIVDSFRRRGFGFLVRPNFDMQLAWCRKDDNRSPFFGLPDEWDPETAS